MKKRSKIILVLLCLVNVVLLTGCSCKSFRFELDGIEKVTVISVSGTKIEISDRDMIDRITDNITSIEFERGMLGRNTNGFGPIIIWYDSSGEAIEAISVMDEKTIMYGEYFWIAVNGSIDLENIDNILLNVN